ncbi:peptidase M23-like protein [Roseibium hamelinense]|uniref:Peptidase M23-like protein n=1 Tax=Roseibium hamelinense TaxID=150831 RepID=A0A562THF7_9HYPH|nr:M23 family metallopeptidase [Roseibium hamelinense]MTI46016.1 M23 family metallopeptidase [Roseibium hamelinense]TWI92793.1 peptidase M23-like protein [Roseibium hamelinense]
MNRESTAVLDALAVAAESKIETVLNATKPLGISLDKTIDAPLVTGAGGPFVSITGQSFEARVFRADRALSALEDLKYAARRLPITRPMKEASISSHFGPRVDPFLKSLAMHTGMDFRATYGSRIYSAGPGTVIHAGWKGGYGKMVEIRHTNGFVTRYAHLSRLQVAEGTHVLSGDVIGNVGSTGRSTGPHLHFEVRHHGKPLDPAAFVKAGAELTPILSF